jgi:hypothetical protein
MSSPLASLVRFLGLELGRGVKVGTEGPNHRQDSVDSVDKEDRIDQQGRIDRVPGPGGMDPRRRCDIQESEHPRLPPRPGLPTRQG